MRALLIGIGAGAALALAGCTTPQVQTRVVEVKVPVQVPCIERAPVRPAYRFGKGKAPGEKEAAVLITADLEAAKLYGVAWEAAAAGCHVGPPARP